MELLERLVEWAQAGLQESEEARSYLQGRGASAEQWARHRLGFARGEFDPDPSEDPFHSEACFDKDRRHLRCDTCRFRLWSSEWVEDDDGGKKQVVCGRMHGSVVLPLTSYSGVLVGVQTRSITEKVFDNFVLNRRPEGYAFGLGAAVHHMWGTRSACVVESPFDQMLMERLAVPWTMALITSSVNRDQMNFLKRFVKRIYWCGDLDKAGRDGLESLIQYHGSEFDIVDVKYPRTQDKDKDPGDFWRRAGDKKFSEHFRKAML